MLTVAGRCIFETPNTVYTDMAEVLPGQRAFGHDSGSGDSPNLLLLRSESPRTLAAKQLPGNVKTGRRPARKILVSLQKR